MNMPAEMESMVLLGYCTCTQNQAALFLHPAFLATSVPCLSFKQIHGKRRKGVSEWELPPSKYWIKTS